MYLHITKLEYIHITILEKYLLQHILHYLVQETELYKTCNCYFVIFFTFIDNKILLNKCKNISKLVTT